MSQLNEGTRHKVTLQRRSGRALLTPTLYAVLQELPTRLLSLLGEGDQGESLVEGQLAQEPVGGVNVLGNL